MGAVKTNHKRHEQIRRLDKACKQWGREDQASEAAEVRRHNRAVKAHKMKRLYPNSIAPERYGKIINEALRIFSKWVEPHMDEYLKMVDDLIINGTSQGEPVGLSSIEHAKIHHFDERANKLFTYRCGIDLASGKDQTGYGGRIE